MTMIAEIVNEFHKGLETMKDGSFMEEYKKREVDLIRI